MKMPEPVATVTDNFATDYSEISRTWQRPIPLGTKLYDKQALIDLLEAAAVECDKEVDIRMSASRKHPDESPSKDRCLSGALASRNCADAIRLMKGKL